MKLNIASIIPGKAIAVAGMVMTLFSCQKMDKPELGDYTQDSNPPGGPLKFYTAFDGTTSNPLMNAVDSIRANFASDNPFETVDGISGKAVKGVNQKFIKYAKPNDWARLAESATIAFWYKHDGQTKNNKGGNGPGHVICLKSSNGHWSGASMLVFLEGNNDGCAVKVMFVDKNMKDAWFTWEGGKTIPGIMDNKWHHIAVVYNAGSSETTLYVDGAANPETRKWMVGDQPHGALNFDDSKITEVRIGAGPSTNYDSDDWLAASWKGALDQFRLYASPLSAADVQALFNGKK
ncbi:LamG domain-containing protein [Flavihumibacter rivuli]|uniref:LamG domain-containing protein n=1 Tax=Flavihumibacter rivuli TaxID=2838156 RepID=UPI001BDDCFE7|nr:LamG domain-containing protein [Flavihumibacter rivuli]ULQ56019.1 LamG domain-containing protein [Flavihumibacter rivuli]